MTDLTLVAAGGLLVIGWLIGFFNGKSSMDKHIAAGWEAAARNENEAIQRGNILLRIEAEVKTLRAIVEGGEDA